MTAARILMGPLKWLACLLVGQAFFAGPSLFGQSPILNDTIWAGTLTASTKVVAHYQDGVKRNTVTGATANGIPMEL